MTARGSGDHRTLDTLLEALHRNLPSYNLASLIMPEFTVSDDITDVTAEEICKRIFMLLSECIDDTTTMIPLAVHYDDGNKRIVIITDKSISIGLISRAINFARAGTPEECYG